MKKKHRLISLLKINLPKTKISEMKIQYKVDFMLKI